MIFKNGKVYDFLKYLSLVVLDAVGVAYDSLAQVWNLPYGDEVFKTCSIVSILIGALIGISSVNYNKQVEYDQEEEIASEEETNEEE